MSDVVSNESVPVSVVPNDILGDDAVLPDIQPVAAEPVTTEPVVQPPVKKSKRRKQVAVVEPVATEPEKKSKKVAKKKSRGRPAVFVGKLKTEICRLIRKFGITKTQEILAAKKGELAACRNQEIVPKPVKISSPTLVKFGKEAKIKVPKGRPRKAA